MAGWDDTPPGNKDKDAQASHFAFNQFSAAFATDAPISASKFGREKLSFDDWSAPPVYALDEHASNKPCLLYTSPSPRDLSTSRMPSSA